MFAYKNIRDWQFLLKEWLPMEEIMAYEKFRDYYEIDDIDQILTTVMKYAKDVIEPSYDDGEKNPAKLVDGKVVIPKSYGPILEKLHKDGWAASNLSKAPDDVILPKTLHWMLWEMVMAANCQIGAMYGVQEGSTNLVVTFADEDIKEKFLPKMFDGDWMGTMCLTEPSAGSDVGDILSKAYPTDDPRIFKIKGQKIFITDGDNDYFENMVHLYLARAEGAKSGTKGISLFIVPKYWVNDDGTLESNDVIATGVEEKMGHHGNPTVALSFGDNNQCRGWLIGKNPLENDGIGEGMAQMFQCMNEARMSTALGALALSNNGFHNAADYARERVQGYRKGEGRVTLDKHPDIKRALLMMKAHVDAFKAMIYRTYIDMDIELWAPDEKARKDAADEIAVNIPLCKAYCSDEAWNVLAEAIQVYGGYGYCEDYPISRMTRDSKILTIWEGTNFIQAQDLVGRKWLLEKGAVFAKWFKNISDFCEENKGTKGLEKEFDILGEAIEAYQQIQGMAINWVKSGQTDMLMAYAKRILMATAQLYSGKLLMEQALLAVDKAQIGSDHFDYKFYTGKVQSARYYLNNVVPNVGLLANIMHLGDTSVLDVDVDSFDY